MLIPPPTVHHRRLRRRNGADGTRASNHPLGTRPLPRRLPQAAGIPLPRLRSMAEPAGNPRCRPAFLPGNPIRLRRQPLPPNHAAGAAGLRHTGLRICRRPRRGNLQRRLPILLLPGRAAPPIARLRLHPTMSGDGSPRAMSSIGRAAGSASRSSRPAIRWASIRPPLCPKSLPSRRPPARMDLIGVAPSPLPPRRQHRERTPLRHFSRASAWQPIS